MAASAFFSSLTVSLLAVVTVWAEIFLRFREVLGGRLLVLVGCGGFDLFSGLRQIGCCRLLFLQLRDFSVLAANVQFSHGDFALLGPQQRKPTLSLCLRLFFGHRLQQEFKVIEHGLRVFGGDRLGFLGGSLRGCVGSRRRGVLGAGR